MLSVDDEWETFLKSQKTNEQQRRIEVCNITNEWDELVKYNEVRMNDEKDLKENNNGLYISTKSKIAFLNQQLNLKKVFWGIQVMPYFTEMNGIVKKQMKYICEDKEELNELKERLKQESFYEEQIITSIDNPSGRIKFKDVRKISIGLSKKDILTSRGKKKSAFYNCFVLILRHKQENIFKDYHVKIFNTGKIKIPGIQNEETYKEILEFLIDLIRPHIEEQICYTKTSDNVLINSNFNCGFYVNQNILYDLLKYKYNIQCVYDPCSYPGLQCKIFYELATDILTNGENLKNATMKESKKSKDYILVSFMIFRTGSILISGKCNEDIIYKIFNFIKSMLLKEKDNIKINSSFNEIPKKEKTEIQRKRNIININLT